MKYMSLPLNAIKSFEAAARQLSFARAAKDLKVHPPAVSRQVAELERMLGVSLFLRSKPRLSLTPQGQELFASVSAGLNEIRQAIECIQYRRQQGLLKVETSIGFASCWLLARLADFRSNHPDIELQMQTRDSTSNYEPQDSDIAIMFGKSPLPAVEARRIFPGVMIPVCTPALLKDTGQLSVAELCRYPLLHYSEPAHFDDWKNLLASVGFSVPQPRSEYCFNSYVVYLQAILNGDGIGIGWEHLLEDHLRDERLVCAAEISVERQRAYYACLQARAVDNADARVFMDWVCEVE